MNDKMQYTDDEHVLLGKVLKVKLIEMMTDAWRHKDLSLPEITVMATDILGVFQEVSVNIDRYLRADANSKAN